MKPTDKEILTTPEKKFLLQIARQAISIYIKENKNYSFDGEITPGLAMKTGMFVTLHKHGRLRGCIGYIIGQEPLWKAAAELAISSALKDSRFPPVTAEEIPELEIEISVLTPPVKVNSPDEIILGEHGVIVKKGWHSGVFLPQVATETGWDKKTFLSELCTQKAGLKEDAWKDNTTELFIFSALIFNEKEFVEK